MAKSDKPDFAGERVGVRGSGIREFVTPHPSPLPTGEGVPPHVRPVPISDCPALEREAVWRRIAASIFKDVRIRTDVVPRKPGSERCRASDSYPSRCWC